MGDTHLVCISRLSGGFGALTDRLSQAPSGAAVIFSRVAMTTARTATEQTGTAPRQTLLTGGGRDGTCPPHLLSAALMRLLLDLVPGARGISCMPQTRAQEN